MKNLLTFQILIMAVLAVLFLACNTSLENSISGTYVNHAESEFSVAQDTLVLEHDKDNSYLIHRKTGFQVIDEAGNKGKQEYETEVWHVVYDESSGRMTENLKGRIISFDLDKGTLKLENSVFKRIN